MRKFMIATPLALAAAAVLATPASAAPGFTNGRQAAQEIQQLERQVDRAEQRNQISRREATQLNRQVDQLEKLHARYARGGFTRTELRSLDSRINTVKQQLRSSQSDHRPGWNGHRR
ncbi:hypothetical protein NT2_01_06210 [Caenibius tardaugens NBRC 16725]|uniref:Uncharacterized protein n=1 Tax=Caenibius tardaugens NBRC 16725 TaxID=1219035 RepID=U2YIE8_9SPHN|nr:hypothetical protein [Caenibius tardaugens]AZI36941.1 hypothetical protein EGO55_14035 [Caenibius tardaugens NBRC 16725]GAD47847.1 hypothetical protein NT2_01_06210 [Caenibius tardaugens NBRC 16725]